MRGKVLSHFKKNDPKLYSVALLIDYKIRPSRGNNYFRNITRSIIGQQLSVKAASTIFGRFEKLIHGEIVPENILSLSLQEMRDVGMSHAKTRYVQEFARMVQDKKINLEVLPEMSDIEATRELVKIKGVGQWTAEMFLMFSLNRPDIFSHGDAGLQRAMKQIYSLNEYDYDIFEKISKKWSPYRTYACDILWQSLDNKPMP